MGSRGAKSGGSYTVTWTSALFGVVVSRATNPKRAEALVERYKHVSPEEGDRIEVEGHTGSRWEPWVFRGGRWQRPGGGHPCTATSPGVG